MNPVKAVSLLTIFLPPYYNHGQKSWDTCISGHFQFTQVQPFPSPHKQCWMHVSRIFFEFQLCIGWGEGELQEKLISKRMHCFMREPRMTKKGILHCSPKDFFT